MYNEDIIPTFYPVVNQEVRPMKLRTKVFAGVTAAFLLFNAGIFLLRNHQVLFGQAAESTQTASQTGRIDLNSATLEQLMLLPGIGETLAQRIITYRETVGPFRQTEDLLNVEGIGRDSLSEIQNYIRIGE